MLACLGFLACAGAGRQQEQEYAALREKVKTIAVARISSSTHWLSHEQVRTAFEGRVSKRLAAAGVEVVPVSAWDELWTRYADDVGGVFDAQTGEADQEKFEVVRDAVIRELVESRRVDAFLYVQVKLVDSFGVKGKPTVCGEDVDVYWPGGWKDPGLGEAASLVRSACLTGLLVDAKGETLSGLQAPLVGVETYDEQTRAVRPSDEILADPQVLDHATSIVLEAFAPSPSARTDER